MFEIKDQYVAVFVKRINRVLTVQGRKKFKINIEHLTFRGKSYHIDTRLVSYRNKNKFLYQIDIDTGQQIVFENKAEADEVKDSDLANLVVEKKVVAQLVAGLVSVGKIPWIWGVVFIALGVAVGYIIGNVLPLHGTP